MLCDDCKSRKAEYYDMIFREGEWIKFYYCSPCARDEFSDLDELGKVG